jgi:hypothetical protein
MTTLRIATRFFNPSTGEWERLEGENGRAKVVLPSEQVQTNALTYDELTSSPLVVDTGLTTQTDALTDAQLRAAPLEVTGALTIDPPALQQVADDYQTGEILPDQIGTGGVLTFTFNEPVQNLWVYAIAANPDTQGEVRVDPFGGAPSASLGIPVAFGGITPIPTTASIVRVFAATGIRVTVYGNRRG